MNSKSSSSDHESKDDASEELRAALELLSQKEAFLNRVIDNLPVGVFCKDATRDYTFMLWNKKQQEITGFSKEKAVGNNDFDLFPEEDAIHFRKVDQEVIDSGKELDIPEEAVDSANLGQIIMHTRKVPLEGARGKEGHYLLGICEDVTEQKKQQEQLLKLNHELLEVNQELLVTNDKLKTAQMQLIQAAKMESIGRLASGVAHEVKNPLGLLLMGVDYLDGTVDKTTDENLSVILEQMREAVERADKIIRGLVDFSSSRQLDLQPEDMGAIINGVLLMVRHESASHQVEIVLNLEEDLPAVLVDKTKIEQVLINLILNAVHALEEVEGKRTLTISTGLAKFVERVYDDGTRTKDHLRPGDSVVYVTVEDNGPGISKDRLEKIWDPFFTTKATGKGTGLGLTVVKKIMDLHHGWIKLSSGDGCGVKAEMCVKIT